MNKIEWVDHLKSVLEEISSKDFQERIWLNGYGPEVSSYEEATEYFFDDFGSEDLIRTEWQKFLSSELQVDNLKIFWETLRAFDNSFGFDAHPRKILENPEWELVRRSARKALKSIVESER